MNEETTIDEFEIPEETVVEKPNGHGEHTTINTELVNRETLMVCPECGMKNYLKNMKCIRCDYDLI